MKAFNTFIKYFLAILMGALTLLTFYQIVMRYVFNDPSSWTEEVIRFLFVYASFLAAGIGIMDRVHIGIDVVVNLLPEKYRFYSQLLVDCMITAFGGVIIHFSYPLLQMTQRQMSPSLRMPMHYVYFAVMLFGGLCCIYSLYNICRTVFRANATGN